MNTTTSDALWARLVAAGLAGGEPPPAAPAHSPWYVRLMLGIAGWIGALFLLGFVGVAMAYVFQSESAALVAGLICCVAAYAIFRAAGNSDFLSQFGLAVSFAGQVLIAFGLWQRLRADVTSLAFLVAGLQVLLAAAYANAIHRSWSTLIAAVALGYGLAGVGLFGIAPLLVAAMLLAVWLNEPLWAQRAELWVPVGYGLALSLVSLDAIPLFGHGINWLGTRVSEPLLPWWTGPLLIGVLWLYVAFCLLQRNQVAAASRSGVAALLAVAVLALLMFRAPGITEALLVLTLGYAVGARVLLGTGALALLAWLAHYYYALHMTLLAKSGVLAATGIVLIALWAGMRLLFPSHTKQEKRDA